MSNAVWRLLLCCCLLWTEAAHAGYNEPVGCGALPALTGTVTTPVGSCATAAGTTALIKISTLTANNTATSLQWTALGSTYNTYLLVCDALSPATSGANVFIQFGEGGTPTWESASYKWAGTQIVSNVTGNGSYGSASASGVSIDLGNGLPNTVTGATSLSAWIYNITSTTVNKSVLGEAGILTTNWNENIFSGAYTGDTNAVTAIRLTTSSGNLTSGTCTLYGVLQ